MRLTAIAVLRFEGPTAFLDPDELNAQPEAALLVGIIGRAALAARASCSASSPGDRLTSEVELWITSPGGH